MTPRPRCEACGLDYGFADAGDGPAVFIMFLAGFIVVGAALIVEALYHPPYWVHAVLWLPLILIVTLGPLRPMKGLMIALQYHHKAEEGQFAAAETHGELRRRPRRSWLGLLIPAAARVYRADRAWHLASSTQGLEGSADRCADRAARRTAERAARRQRLATPRSGARRIPAASNSPRNSITRRKRWSMASASAFRPDVSGPGYWVFTPARLADGSIVIVNRGFVPEDRKDPKSRADGQISGPVDIVGAMRWPDTRHWFTPNDDAAHNLWFSRDPQAIAAAKGLGAVAPFYVEQEAPVPPGGLPQPGKLVVALPDNHLQYAITWYGLAAALVVVFVVWAFGTRAARDRPGRPSLSL